MLEYKKKDTQKQKNRQKNTEDKPDIDAPLIDPNFSTYCQNKMINGESILSDMKERYNEIVPHLDFQFVEKFFDYVENEKTDYIELLNAFLINDTQTLLQCGIMNRLFKKIPNSFYQIYLALEYGGDLALYEFDRECGFYQITRYSFENSFKLVIGKILLLTITKIVDYGYFQPPFTSLFALDSDVNYPDLNCTHLITNLLASNDVEIIINALKALRISFSANVKARVILGYVFMNFFDPFIRNSDLATETVLTFAAGYKDFPFDTNMNKTAAVCESLLLSNNDILINVGLKLVIILIDHQYEEINKNLKGSILDIFENTQILRLLYQIAQNGSFKHKLSVFKAFKSITSNSESKELKFLISNGLFQLLSDTFMCESAESSADPEIILISIDILLNALKKGIYAQVQEEHLAQMVNFFKYLKGLTLNENEKIAEHAQKAYLVLMPFYGEFVKEE